MSAMVALTRRARAGDAAARAARAMAVGTSWSSSTHRHTSPVRSASAPSSTSPKSTVAAVANVSTHPDAVDVELEAQVWSLGQPEFRDRLAALKDKISSGGRPSA